MDVPEAHTHSFVIKVWLEETSEEASQIIWRGHITHVPSGVRRYFQELVVISDFVQSYLSIKSPNNSNGC